MCFNIYIFSEIKRKYSKIFIYINLNAPSSAKEGTITEMKNKHILIRIRVSLRLSMVSTLWHIVHKNVCFIYEVPKRIVKEGELRQQWEKTYICLCFTQQNSKFNCTCEHSTS